MVGYVKPDICFILFYIVCVFVGAGLLSSAKTGEMVRAACWQHGILLSGGHAAAGHGAAFRLYRLLRGPADRGHGQGAAEEAAVHSAVGGGRPAVRAGLRQDLYADGPEIRSPENYRITLEIYMHNMLQ